MAAFWAEGLSSCTHQPHEHSISDLVTCREAKGSFVTAGVCAAMKHCQSMRKAGSSLESRWRGREDDKLKEEATIRTWEGALSLVEALSSVEALFWVETAC